MSKIKELEEKINKARLNYYNGSSTVSDKVFDTWISELETLDPKNPAVIGIGAEPVSSWDKFTHKIPMGSLNKAQTDDEFKNWHNKYASDKNDFLLTLKLDGLSVSLIYENGVLVKGVTRGSGVTGEIITPNIIKMGGVPLRLKEKLNLTVRGEILLSKDNFKNHFKDGSNERNSASGTCRRHDGQDCDKLDILSYQLFCDELDFNTFEEQFTKLKQLGFNVPDHSIVKSADEAIKVKNEYHSVLRDQYPYLLDGLVIHLNDVAKHEEYGINNLRPYASLAIKFDSVAKEGTISHFDLQVGTMGRVTPVANFNPPVDLLGTKVSRASCHNFSNVKDLGLGVGAKVLICRSGDVIPFIEEVIEAPEEVLDQPTNCPECNSALINVGEYVQCINTTGCPAQRLGKLTNWIKELNVLEWGESVLTKLLDSGKVNDIADLYKLSVKDLESLDRMGEKSAKKCYDILHANKNIPLDIFLGGLSIPSIGGSTIRAIMNAGCDTIEKFGQLKAEHFEQVPGVGPSKAKALAEGLVYNQKLILDLLDVVTIKSKPIGKLSNTSVCFTGAMVNKRPILEKMAQDAGADVKSSVGKGLSYLVINDLNSTSSKAVKAKSLGTKLISEDEFLEIVK